MICLIIQTVRRDRGGVVWIDGASKVSRPEVSRPDRSGAVQGDAEHPARHRMAVGSNPRLHNSTSQPR
jgi:hypothetical protein